MEELHGLEMGCQECKKWEEHFYWNHFGSTKLCFFKVLIADFSKTLTIPRKFALNFKHLKDLQNERVQLKGPSGNEWSVQLRTSRGEVVFAEGWKEFVEDHELEEGDFLVFRYAGDSCFRVQAFDMSGCEKAHAYFVGGYSDAAAAARGGGGGRRRKRENSGEAQYSHHEDGRCSAAVLQTKAAVMASNADNKLLVDRSGRKTATTSTWQHQNIELIVSSSDSEEVKEEDGKGKASMPPKMPPEVTMNKQCSSSIIRSTRRAATAAEKQKALALAKSVKSVGPAFITIMRQSAVLNGSVLVIPVKFAEERLPVQDQEVLLRLAGGERTWGVKYFYHNKAAKLGSGWRQFALDNGLEEDDVCRLELITITGAAATSGSSKLMFEVRIFPAVVEAPPLPLRRTEDSSKRNHKGRSVECVHVG